MFDLVEIWRIKNPQTKSYTWSQNSPTILCQLDFWLISNNLCDFVVDTNIIPAIKTDHTAISLRCYYDQNFMARMQQKHIANNVLDVAVPVKHIEIKFQHHKVEILNLRKRWFLSPPI